MKTLEFTDSELEEFKHLLKWAISNSWDNYYASLDEEDKKVLKDSQLNMKRCITNFLNP